jgi:hypothetical protein
VAAGEEHEGPCPRIRTKFQDALCSARIKLERSGALLMDQTADQDNKNYVCPQITLITKRMRLP